MNTSASPWIFTGERILVSIWVGGTWVIGYLVAPLLFNQIKETALAGSVAGQLIRIMSLAGLPVLMAVLLRLVWQQKRRCIRYWLFWVVCAALGLLLMNVVVVYPEMAAVRALGIEAGTERAEYFRRLHGLSALIYLLVSISGLLLVAVQPSTDS